MGVTQSTPHPNAVSILPPTIRGPRLTASGSPDAEFQERPGCRHGSIPLRGSLGQALASLTLALPQGQDALDQAGRLLCSSAAPGLFPILWVPARLLLPPGLAAPGRDLL